MLGLDCTLNGALAATLDAGNLARSTASVAIYDVLGARYGMGAFVRCEYRGVGVERPTVYVRLFEVGGVGKSAPTDALKGVVEVAGDNASAKAAALHGKELDAYKKSAEKNYSKMSAELNEVRRSMKKAGGNELLVLNVKALQAEKAMVEALREDARVATASGDKAYAKKTKKRLARDPLLLK